MALGVKQSNCPLGVFAHGRVCEVDPESDQCPPAPTTTPEWTETRLWPGCPCQDIECDSHFPACSLGEFDVDVDSEQSAPPPDPPTTPERKSESDQCPPASPCGPDFRVASCPAPPAPDPPTTSSSSTTNPPLTPDTMSVFTGTQQKSRVCPLLEYTALRKTTGQ